MTMITTNISYTIMCDACGTTRTVTSLDDIPKDWKFGEVPFDPRSFGEYCPACIRYKSTTSSRWLWSAIDRKAYDVITS
jgi:hypothetical protein